MLNGLSFKNQVNAVGGLAFLVIGGFFAYDLTRSRDAAPCGARYPVTTQISLTKADGTPLAPGELQARMGFGERGLFEKARVIKPVGGPAPYALDVKVGGPIDADTGAHFFWMPNGVAKAQSACLSYQVFVPVDFDYSRGGKLPGLFGGFARGGASANQSGFATRFAWDDQGAMSVEANFSDLGGSPQSPPPSVYSSNMLLPRGQWVQIDQEVALNAPNAQNGILRLWVDGRLKLEDPAVAWRGSGGMVLSGVLADIGYTSVGGIEKPAKVQSITVSPMKLAWN
jgi:hypothetical protein